MTSTHFLLMNVGYGRMQRLCCTLDLSVRCDFSLPLISLVTMVITDGSEPIRSGRIRYQYMSVKLVLKYIAMLHMVQMELW